MSNVEIGSARIDEYGNIANGKAGDQKQKATPDYNGEVSREKFYVHKLGWNVLRAKDNIVANKLAIAMATACDNPNIGYDQNQRLNIITHGIFSTNSTECDCSSLVRACIIDATGIDVGNFTTYNEASILVKSGMFDKIKYEKGMALMVGDILVTQSKGHTAIVIEGYSRVTVSEGYSEVKYYDAYKGSTADNLDKIFKAIGVDDKYIGNKDKREPIARINGIVGYSGTYEQNVRLKILAREGKLIRL